ncbi:hypothetical protein ENSA5_07200 [Enhygromyxa salina]|uniref:NAD(P)-binding domain-containing protein n=1 Tax=Enhygromyxa salina TaxID=215803 RepID=A0A2S9YHA7_9BACT|nr:NAD(P)H-binding protein [Enhygromyxa salina]PRQ04489.1 hypothetical protein ENSA5_07200 [Enhygromyxa salina]
MDGPTSPAELVFVAGATGYTGRAVVREAIAWGLDAVAHVRPDSARLDHWRAHFEELGARVDTTPWVPAEIQATLERLAPSQIHALLGTTRKRGKRGSGSAVADTYEAVDYGLPIMLLEAALASGSRPRFVYLSALGADRPSMNAYMAVRRRVELAVRESGLPYVIARPGFISGDDRDEPRAGERVASVISDGVLSVLGALGAKRTRARYSSLTGSELGAALVRLACTADEDGVIAEADALRAAATSRRGASGFVRG